MKEYTTENIRNIALVSHGSGGKTMLAEAFLHTTGATTRLFRPPFGGRRPVVLRTVRDMGYEPIMWSVTTWDWKPRSPAEPA